MTHPDENLDNLEREFQAMKPVSPSPALRPRIDTALKTSRPLCFPWYLAAGVAASLLVIFALIPTTLHNTWCYRSTMYMEPPPDNRPSLWAYHKAAGRSSEDLDNLLDTHARTLPPLGAPTPRSSTPIE